MKKKQEIMLERDGAPERPLTETEEETAAVKTPLLLFSFGAAGLLAVACVALAAEPGPILPILSALCGAGSVCSAWAFFSVAAGTRRGLRMALWFFCAAYERRKWLNLILAALIAALFYFAFFASK